MLDSPTKRRIDGARDVLVGKLPDPKAQIEQITTALIYKFMHDMDVNSLAMGGVRGYFVGDFERYAWDILMSPKLGGEERWKLYSEAITKMSMNPNLPQLFRDIFKDAFLPYRDPETLNLFLKEINGFTYSHSEDLGDAFEYLLAVMGSQGDAGQFRTPRHIIDFIVGIVDPKKDETILDPACGTAGFLISAYKHILEKNADNKPGDKLTPDEKTSLMNQITGYDISPDMVRLSLVNMYLHGFAAPQISEYDTLTYEDKWDENYDVIMANPPFMSPKGGIRPHKRFTVQANRSEVLFVDYIAEHTTANGRAGVIVPEGIIFQSQTAYKALRKMLVDNYLVAVISLPAGVFNPYSGVKTSILILDKSLAKRADAIIFFKVKNDGLGLGAQRREINKNDLPQVRSEITEYLRRLRANEQAVGHMPMLGLIVPKEKIAENGDYNLSGERYRAETIHNHIFPLVRIGDICSVNPRKSQLDDLSPDTRVSFVPMSDLNEHRIAFQPIEEKCLSEVTTSYTYFEDNDVLLAKVTPCFENGKAGIARELLNGIGFGSSEFYVLRPTTSILPEWVYFCVTSTRFRDAAILHMTGTGGLQRVPRGYVENFQIPLPPLEVQKEIVLEIEGYQKVIDGARIVVDNYRPHIPIDPVWPMVELGEVCKIKGGYAFKSSDFVEKGIQLIRMGNVKKMSFDYQNSQVFLPSSFKNDYKNYLLKKDDILISMTGTTGKEDYGNVSMIDIEGDFLLNQRVGKFEIDTSKLNPYFVYNVAQSTQFRNSLFSNSSGGVRQANISNKEIEEIQIHLPPVETQQAIVAEIESEQKLVSATRELIERFEKKIQDTLSRVWGDNN